SLPFELHWTEIPYCGVPPPGIVKALDVIEHIGFRLISGAVCGSRRALGLQRGKEAFHGGVVPAVAGATHARSKALVREETLERLAGVMGGFNRSTQHWVVRRIVGTGLGLRLVSSNQASSAVWY